MIAKVNLKLDKDVQPLPVDSIFRVRYRSSFGLKYVEIVRGEGDPAPEGYVFNGTDDGATCALPLDAATFEETIATTAKNGCFQPQTEFDDIANTFDPKTRAAVRTNLTGYGSAFAGRGTSLNDAIGSLEPLFKGLRPVTRVLLEPDTRFENFFPALGRTAAIVAPGRRAAGRLLHQGRDRVRGDLLRSAGAAGHDLRDRADARDRDRRAAAPAPLPDLALDPRAQPAARRHRPARDAAGAQRGDRGRDPGAGALAGDQPAPRGGPAR